MPFIDTKTTAHIDEKQEAALRAAFGKAISLIPGKSEEWLMLNFTGDCRMAFRGTATPDVAMLEVKIFGKARPADLDRLTAELCKIVTETLGVPADRTYVKYEEVEHWGFAGSNF